MKEKEKEKEIREGLNRLLSEQETPVDNRSIPERIWGLRERIKGLRSEAEDLSSLLKHHSGSRLSQVVDILGQAETLTEETMSLTTNQVPSQEFRVEETEEYIYIWDDSEKIGIRFEKGDRLAQYRLTDVIEDGSLLTTDEGMRKFDETRRRLLSFARENYPREFETEVH